MKPGAAEAGKRAGVAGHARQMTAVWFAPHATATALASPGSGTLVMLFWSLSEPSPNFPLKVGGQWVREGVVVGYDFVAVAYHHLPRRTQQLDQTLQEKDVNMY